LNSGTPGFKMVDEGDGTVFFFERDMDMDMDREDACG
jgi:hypothetical protein